MTPGDRTSCLGTPSPHALSQRLLEYSRLQGFPQVSTGTIRLVLGLSESDLRNSTVEKVRIGLFAIHAKPDWEDSSNNECSATRTRRKPSDLYSQSAPSMPQLVFYRILG